MSQGHMTSQIASKSVMQEIGEEIEGNSCQCNSNCSCHDQHSKDVVWLSCCVVLQCCSAANCKHRKTKLHKSCSHKGKMA